MDRVWYAFSVKWIFLMVLVQSLLWFHYILLYSVNWKGYLSSHNWHDSARWIGNHGFSIGIDDVQPGKELVEKKTMEIEKGYGICEAYIASFKKGELEDAPGCDAAQTLEANITKELNAIRVKTGQVRSFCNHFVCALMEPSSS